MPFIVYGCGKIAESLIVSNPDEVYGVMDFYKTGQMFCGKQVLSNEEVISSGVKKIIVAARKASIPIIYRRIADFCRENGIDIYDTEHNIISQVLSGEDELSFRHSESLSKELKGKILSAEVISFDIFDTLIGRRCLYPTDSDEVFENEKKAIYPRKEIIDYYDFARDIGKTVLFCSDMHFNSGQLCELLNMVNIEAWADDIVVSCEHGVEKTDGLFGILKDRAFGKKVLHIGDSHEADYTAAKKNGIKSVKIDSRLDVFEKSKYSALLKYDNKPENRRVIGELLASDLALEDFIAPIIYKFVAWLKQCSCNFDIILLSARDGWLIDTVRKTIPAYSFPAVYFLVSRTAAVSAAVFSESDYDEVLEYPFSGTENEYFVKRFAMDKIGNTADVIEHSEKMRRNYSKYFEGLNIPQGAKVGFMDLVSGGTCLKNLRKFLPCGVRGLYLAPIEDFSNHDAQDSFLYEEAEESNILKYYLMLEESLSSYEPTLKCFDENAKPVYFTEKRTDEQLESLKTMQNKILDYGKRTVDIDFTRVDLALCDEILGMIRDTAHIAEDEYCGR